MMIVIAKRLSTNDTNSSIHQAGILVSRDSSILSFFPVLDEDKKNPRTTLVFVDDDGNEWFFNYIHYNNKIISDGTRDEYRLTGMTAFIKLYNLSKSSLLFMWKENGGYRISCQKPLGVEDSVLPSAGWKAFNLDDSDFTLENSEELLITDDAENEEYTEKLEIWDIDDSELMSREMVRVIKKDYSVFELFRKSCQKPPKLYLDVSFQRNGVWNKRQKNELIESILLGLPLPIFYFKQENDASLSVIDGKQRLSSIFSYMKDEYRLRGLKILRFLNGKKYSDLKDDYSIYQTQLEDYQLYSHVIMPPTPDRYIFEIFGRVNRAGTKLNKQEIRNAMYHGTGMEMIKRIAKSDIFQNVTGIDYENDKRMKNSYMITRFISFYFLKNKQLMVEMNGTKIPYEYDGNMDGFLEKTLRRLNALSNASLCSLETKIYKALQLADSTLGRRAFRRNAIENNPLNQVLFEIEMCCLTEVVDTINSDTTTDITDAVITATNDKAFNDYLDRSRNNKSDVNNRIARFMTVFYEERGLYNDKANINTCIKEHKEHNA